MKNKPVKWQPWINVSMKVKFAKSVKYVTQSHCLHTEQNNTYINMQWSTTTKINCLYPVQYSNQQMWDYTEKTITSPESAVSSILYSTKTLTFDPKFWSIHLCPIMQRWCNFGENVSNALQDIVLTMFWDAHTDEQDKTIMPPGTLWWTEA